MQGPWEHMEGRDPSKPLRYVQAGCFLGSHEEKWSERDDWILAVPFRVMGRQQNEQA